MFTPTRAAAVTGLSLKSVQKAIDLKLVPWRRVREKGAAKRYLTQTAVLCLYLQAEGLHHLPLRARKVVFKAITNSPRQPKLSLGPAISVDIAGARKRLAVSLQALKKAEHMVTSDAAIMTGAPVFKGTRIPAHTIAEIVNAGTPIAEILEGYPTLTAEQVRLAPIYAKANPLHGRPRDPWSGWRPLKHVRKRLQIA
jgi:uncharacterized protein (DUF433 family)